MTFAMMKLVISAIHIQQIHFGIMFHLFAGVVIIKHRFWTPEPVKNIQLLQYVYRFAHFLDTMKNIFQSSQMSRCL